MSRFYIKEISASGENVEFSSISFRDGMNIIYGPSNTGKSYIISCINFIFGSNDVPFTKAETGYDTVSAERLIHRIRDTRIHLNGGAEIFVTVSIGYTSKSDEYQNIIRMADKAMYRAKADEKNRAACLD